MSKSHQIAGWVILVRPSAATAIGIVGSLHHTRAANGEAAIEQAKTWLSDVTPEWRFAAFAIRQTDAATLPDLNTALHKLGFYDFDLEETYVGVVRELKRLASQAHDS